MSLKKSRYPPLTPVCTVVGTNFVDSTKRLSVQSGMFSGEKSWELRGCREGGGGEGSTNGDVDMVRDKRNHVISPKDSVNKGLTPSIIPPTVLLQRHHEPCIVNRKKGALVFEPHSNASVLRNVRSVEARTATSSTSPSQEGFWHRKVGSKQVSFKPCSLFLFVYSFNHFITFKEPLNLRDCATFYT